MAQEERTGLPTPRLLSLAYNASSYAIYRRLVDAGIVDTRPSHGNVMEHLAFEDGLRLNDLARKAGITPQSMGQFVDELEELGYVERRPDPEDRRAKRVYLTSKGKRSNRIEWNVVKEVESALEELLGPRRLRELRKTLSQVIEKLD